MCVSSFNVFILITCEWTSLWKLLADCTSTMHYYFSADVFKGRHIVPITWSSLNVYKHLIVQDYGNVISMQFTGSYYRCYTVLRVPAILSNLFCPTFWKYTLLLSVLLTCVQCSHCTYAIKHS